MSRIGKLPITVPAGVKINIKDNLVTITGPKGELSRQFNHEMIIKVDNSTLTVARPSDSMQHKALHGLSRTLLANMVEGVTKGYEKSLEVVGVGYRAQKQGDKLVMNLGMSHQVEVAPPKGITFDVEGARVKVKGANKELVGQTAAEIRARRLPDSYKGKGIRYAGEVVRLKPGKAGKAIGQTK